MEMKELQREIIDAQRLVERGQIIISLSEQLASSMKENERLAAEIKALQDKQTSSATE